MDRYLAAADRLRRVASGEDALKIYNHPLGPAYDYRVVYDAEHDREPASVEWLKTLPLEYFGEAAAWSFTSGLVCVGGLYLREPETFMNIGKQPLGRSPTRGDVLTALRLFGKKEGAA